MLCEPTARRMCSHYTSRFFKRAYTNEYTTLNSERLQVVKKHNNMMNMYTTLHDEYVCHTT